MPRGVRAIEVRYDFRPHDTGLGFSTNVVDIGIFDPSGKGLGNADGFRGWSGGARRHFRLSHHWATPGYLAGPITPGRWHVILGPFLITPPGTPWHVTVTLEHGAPVRAGVRAPTTHPSPCPAPARAGTAATCTPTASTPTAAGPRPSSSPRRRANGLDFLGTSDHNTNAATRVFGRVVPDDFLVVSGEEVTTRNGHWLATGTTPGTWVDWRYRAADQQLAALHRPDAQPRWRSRSQRTRSCRSPAPAGTSARRGARSTRSRSGTARGRSSTSSPLNAWQQQLVAGGYTPAVGNSDSHHDGQVVGLPQTVYRLDTLSSAAIVAAARGGHCWIAESSAVDLDLHRHGRGATTTVGGPGDTVVLAAGEQLACSLTVTGVPGTVAPDRQQRRAGLGRRGRLRGDHAPGDVAASEGFVRAEVRRGAAADPTTYQSTLPMVALTNPVFVTA